MLKLINDILKKDRKNQYDMYGKILNIIIVISLIIFLIFIILQFSGLLHLSFDYFSFDFPIRILSLVIAFIFNYKRKTNIAKYIFLIVHTVLSFRLLIINTSISQVPVILTFFILFPIYISFFINPKAGLFSGAGLIFMICCYYIYIIIYKPYLFEQIYDFSFATIFLTPILLIFLVTIAFYYFTKKNNEYVKEIEQSATHTISILNSVTDILIVLNPDGYIQTINNAGLKILEYSKKDLLGKPFYILFKSRNNGEDIINKIYNNIFFNNFKSVLITKNKMEIIAGLNSSVIFNKEKDKITEIIITARDLTRLFKYTKKLKRMNLIADSYHSSMLNILEDLNEKNRILAETEHKVKESSKLLEKNIEQAKEHQTKLITVKKPYLYNVRFSTAYIPCEKVGGDIINIIVMKDIIFFYIADVVGHGVPAAILSSFIKASLDNWIKDNDTISPSILLKKLYDVLVEEEIFKEKFFTIFIGKIFLHTLELQYISAGHLSPILVNLENDEISEITIKGRPVISMFELQNNKHYSMTLPEKSKLLVYSDGLIEWEVNEGEFFGKSKLLKYFQKEKLSAKNLNLILERVGNNQIDDISFILIDINDTYERTVHCGIDQIDDIISEFEEEIQNRYKIDSVAEISHCFGELFTNAIVHGNKNNVGKETVIKVLFKKDLIVLSVRDTGEGFDWQAHNFFLKDSDKKEENHGLAYVSTISETLVFNEKGNEVQCTFTIQN